MPDAPEPIRSLLAEAMLYLSALGRDVSFDREAGGSWRYFLDGAAILEGDLIEKARALGMLKTGSIQ